MKNIIYILIAAVVVFPTLLIYFQSEEKFVNENSQFIILSSPDVKVSDNIEISEQHLNYVLELDNTNHTGSNKQLDINVNAQFTLDNGSSKVVAKVKHNLVCQINRNGTLALSGSGICQNNIGKNFCYVKVLYRHKKDIIKNNVRTYMFEVKYGLVNVNESKRKDIGINLNKSIFFTWSPHGSEKPGTGNNQ